MKCRSGLAPERFTAERDVERGFIEFAAFNAEIAIVQDNGVARFAAVWSEEEFQLSDLNRFGLLNPKVAQAFADFMNAEIKPKGRAPRVVVGYDWRKNSETLAASVASVLAGNGVETLLSNDAGSAYDRKMKRS